MSLQRGLTQAEMGLCELLHIGREKACERREQAGLILPGSTPDLSEFTAR
jgi:hypothetical protein